MSIFATSPFALSTVSVWTSGALSPMRGIGSAPSVDTCTCPVAPVSAPSGSLVVASTAYGPRLGNVDVGGVDRGERVLGGRRLLGAVARVGQQHVGGRDERADGRVVRRRRDVDRGRAVDRQAVAGRPSRTPSGSVAGGEDRAGHRQRRAGGHAVGELLRASCRRRPGTRPRRRLRLLDLLADAGLVGTLRTGSGGVSRTCRRRRRRRRAGQGKRRAGRDARHGEARLVGGCWNRRECLDQRRASKASSWRVAVDEERGRRR